jgi:mono/diheme cytochrome c family protein
MCVQCHSPRDESGNLIRAQLLKGAPVPVSRPRWIQDWAIIAPRIAGLPGYTEQDALRLYMKGIARTGKPPMPPMPPFRLTEQDARDIYAFLTTVH